MFRPVMYGHSAKLMSLPLARLGAELEGMSPELRSLYRVSRPCPGRPGWRVDGAGREWYSAAWLGLHPRNPALA